ncbi:MAG: hypothetical protein WCW01_03965 [Gammaproteobacteria bacterium]
MPKYIVFTDYDLLNGEIFLNKELVKRLNETLNSKEDVTAVVLTYQNATYQALTNSLKQKISEKLYKNVKKELTKLISLLEDGAEKEQARRLQPGSLQVPPSAILYHQVVGKTLREGLQGYISSPYCANLNAVFPFFSGEEPPKAQQNATSTTSSTTTFASITIPASSSVSVGSTATLVSMTATSSSVASVFTEDDIFGAESVASGSGSSSSPSLSQSAASASTTKPRPPRFMPLSSGTSLFDEETSAEEDFRELRDEIKRGAIDVAITTVEAMKNKLEAKKYLTMTIYSLVVDMCDEETRGQSEKLENYFKIGFELLRTIAELNSNHLGGSNTGPLQFVVDDKYVQVIKFLQGQPGVSLIIEDPQEQTNATLLSSPASVSSGSATAAVSLQFTAPISSIASTVVTTAAPLQSATTSHAMFGSQSNTLTSPFADMWGGGAPTKSFEELKLEEVQSFLNSASAKEISVKETYCNKTLCEVLQKMCNDESFYNIKLIDATDKENMVSTLVDVEKYRPLIKILRDNGANIDAIRSSDNYTAWQYASKSQCFCVAKFLGELGADTNAPLPSAATGSESLLTLKLKEIQFLLSKNGKLAEEYCNQTFCDIVDEMCALELSERTVNPQFKDLVSDLFTLDSLTYEKIITLLIQGGLNVNVLRSIEQCNNIKYASDKGFFKVARLLEKISVSSSSEVKPNRDLATKAAIEAKLVGVFGASNLISSQSTAVPASTASSVGSSSSSSSSAPKAASSSTAISTAPARTSVAPVTVSSSPSAAAAKIAPSTLQPASSSLPPVASTTTVPAKPTVPAVSSTSAASISVTSISNVSTAGVAVQTKPSATTVSTSSTPVVSISKPVSAPSASVPVVPKGSAALPTSGASAVKPVVSTTSPAAEPTSALSVPSAAVKSATTVSSGAVSTESMSFADRVRLFQSRSVSSSSAPKPSSSVSAPIAKKS